MKATRSFLRYQSTTCRCRSPARALAKQHLSREWRTTLILRSGEGTWLLRMLTTFHWVSLLKHRGEKRRRSFSPWTPLLHPSLDFKPSVFIRIRWRVFHRWAHRISRRALTTSCPTASSANEMFRNVRKVLIGSKDCTTNRWRRFLIRLSKKRMRHTRRTNDVSVLERIRSMISSRKPNNGHDAYEEHSINSLLASPKIFQ